MSEQPRPPARWTLLLVGALSAALLTSLPLLALAGRKVRPASDDWCLSPIGRDQGFGAVVRHVYEDWNGRFFNAVADGVVYSTYGTSSRMLPGLVLLALAVGLGTSWALLANRALGLARWPAILTGCTLGPATVLALLVGKPASYQSIYHSATIISHTLTIVLALLVGLLVVGLHGRGRVYALATAVLGGVVLGTFNEAFTAACLVSVAALLLALRFGATLPVRASALWGLGVGLLGGFASVYFSPGSQDRRATIKNSNPLDPHVWSQTLDNWFTVVKGTVTTPAFGLLVGTALLVGGLWLRRSVVRPLALWLPVAWAVSASVAACFVLTFSFNGLLTLRERTWPSMTISVLLLTGWLALCVGAWLGRATEQLPVPVGRLAGAGLLVAAVALVGLDGLRAAHQTRAIEHKVSMRAEAFDAADRDVRRQLATGTVPVLVRPAPIDGLYEPFYPSPRWPASCLPSYYRHGHAADYKPYPRRHRL